jgi:hypothetical protein
MENLSDQLQVLANAATIIEFGLDDIESLQNEKGDAVEEHPHYQAYGFFRKSVLNELRKLNAEKV